MDKQKEKGGKDIKGTLKLIATFSILGLLAKVRLTEAFK